LASRFETFFIDDSITIFAIMVVITPDRMKNSKGSHSPVITPVSIPHRAPVTTENNIAALNALNFFASFSCIAYPPNFDDNKI
jgi:hypothetical protein